MMNSVRQYIPSGTTVKARLTTTSAWELPRQESALAPKEVWTNEDMDPVPPEKQTWTVWTWMAYWATDVVNLGTWETASAILDVGLTWRDAIPIMVVGTTCIAIPMVLNGAIGQKMKIPFSVIIRSSFGYYLAYFCICSRAILAMFWLGIQGANGAYAITIMINAVWTSYTEENIPNTLPADGGITTRGMISYFLFWIIQLPLLLIPPTKLRYLFAVKLVAAPIAAIAMMAWCIHTAGGSGAIFNIPGTLSGSKKTYTWLSCMSSVTGSWATLACNIPDFSRYAKSRPGKTSKAQYIQLPCLPFIFTLCGIMGIISTSCSYIIWGQYYWNPLDIVNEWLAYGHGGRTAAFFSALAWYIAQVGSNITANSISAANDLTVLCPRYINIFRGCIIAAVIGGWVIVPWKILSSATTFLSFMGGYAVFLSPISAIMVADYFLVKKQRFDVPALYSPQGRYRYDYGCNWRAAVAFFVAVGPNLPGLANSISGISVPAGFLDLYTIDWLYGFVSGLVVYTACSYAFPATETLVPRTLYGHTIIDDEVGDGVERVNNTELSGKGFDKESRTRSITMNTKAFHDV